MSDTPVLRADATDDQDELEPEAAAVVPDDEPETLRQVHCPACMIVREPHRHVELEPGWTNGR